MYMSAWFWDSRVNWHPESVSWSDPRTTIGYIAQGYEGGIGVQEVTDEAGNRWMKTNKWRLPMDKDKNSQFTNRSTIMIGHAGYDTDWAAAADGAVEQMLSGKEGVTPKDIRAYSKAKRKTPECMPPHAGAGAGHRNVNLCLELENYLN